MSVIALRPLKVPSPTKLVSTLTLPNDFEEEFTHTMLNHFLICSAINLGDFGYRQKTGASQVLVQHILDTSGVQPHVRA